MRTCSCHGLPMMFTSGEYRCQVKRRASWRNSKARYRATPQGLEQMHHDNQRRMFIGRDYMGTCGFTKTEREELINGATD